MDHSYGVQSEKKQFQSTSMDNADCPLPSCKSPGEQNRKMSSAIQNEVYDAADENVDKVSTSVGFKNNEDKEKRLTGQEDALGSSNFRPRSKTLSDLGKIRRKCFSRKGLYIRDSWKQAYDQRFTAQPEANILKRNVRGAMDKFGGMNISSDHGHVGLKHAKGTGSCSFDGNVEGQLNSDDKLSSTNLYPKDIKPIEELRKGHHHSSAEEVSEAEGFGNCMIDKAPRGLEYLKQNILFQEHDLSIKNPMSSMESMNSETETWSTHVRKRSSTVSVPNSRRISRLKVNTPCGTQSTSLNTKARRFLQNSSDYSFPDLNDQSEFRQRSFTMTDSSSVRKMRGNLSRRLNVSLQSSISSTSFNHADAMSDEVGVAVQSQKPVLVETVLSQQPDIRVEEDESQKSTAAVSQTDLKEGKDEEVAFSITSSLKAGVKRGNIHLNFDKTIDQSDHDSISVVKEDKNLDESKERVEMLHSAIVSAPSLEATKTYSREKRRFKKRHSWFKQCQHRNLSPIVLRRNRMKGGEVQRKSKVSNAIKPKMMSLFSKSKPGVSSDEYPLTSRSERKSGIRVYLEEKHRASPSYVLAGKLQKS